jgi:hypothetical protein
MSTAIGRAVGWLLLVLPMAWAESTPCLSQKTEGIFNGVVMMTKPAWLVKECGRTEAQVLLQMRLWIKGNGRSPFSDESYLSTNPKGASILLKALDDAGWKKFSENSVRAGGIVAKVRHYKHDRFGFLAFGVTETRTELFLSFVRYR